MSWQKDRKDDVRKLKMHCDDLKAKLDLALNQLSLIARNYGDLDENDKYSLQKRQQIR